MTFEVAAIAVVLIAPAGFLLTLLALLGGTIAALGAPEGDPAGPPLVSRRLRLVRPRPEGSTD
jgi:hypothetical protein